MKLVEIAVLVVLIAFLSVAGSAASDTFTLEKGEVIDLDSYRMSFENSELPEKDAYIGFREETDGADRILFKLYLEEIYEGRRNVYLESEGFNFTVNRIGSSENGQYMNVTLDSRDNIFSSAELDSDSPERVIARRNDKLPFQLTLTNTGTKNQSFNLGYSAPEGVNVKFSYMDFNVSTVDIPAGEFREIGAEATIGEDASIGMKNLTFIAEGDENYTKSFNLEIRGTQKEKGLTAELGDRSETVRPGDSIRPDIVLYNSGEAELKNVELDVEAPEGWEVRRYERAVEVGGEGMRPGERENYGMRIEVPQNAEPGDYYIEMTGSSDSLETETKELRVTVASNSGLSWIGIGLMLVSLAGMLGVYIKLGRR